MPTDMRRRRVGARCTAAVLLAAMLLACAGCRAEQAPLYVDGEPVTEEELALLDGNPEPAVRMRLLQRLAAEYTQAEAFSFDGMLRQLEEENRTRAQRAAAGEPVYGLLEYSPLQYYSIWMDGYERAIKDQWIAGAPREELAAYYEAHREEYRQVGEITADVQIWLGDRLASRQEVVLSAANYRILSEENEALVWAMEGLEPGDIQSWTDQQGLEWTVTCTGRTADTYEEFENVRGAVSEQWASAKLAEELAARAATCSVRDLR